MIQIRSSSFQNFPHAHIMHCTDNVMHHLLYPGSLMFYRVSLDIVSLDILLTSDINQSSFVSFNLLISFFFVSFGFQKENVQEKIWVL